ncbi:MAG TPA: VOC family protein [Dehalococcoidia bacterium]|nr:VOC family protein [Dehalococcoidia bacterium]
MVRAKPDNYHTLTPFFQLRGADRFLDFVKDSFGAEVTELVRAPDGSVMHAEFRIGDSMAMLGEGDPKPLALYVYIDDVDGVYQKALAAGGRSSQEPRDQFWGDRQAAVLDAWDNMWFIATHTEDVSPEELQRRMAAAAPAG